ncbi:Oidioi.mRNA.OKI2018_I69.PAR.g13192.t1.cds [Oikopleura dioica]|uniref:Oidioi.mRNA.OKI2018_I69.PAR.g13192.t1.cds n=1 Tax=Oikopleura dioica TaxID=34765 RepID=A0ABN7S3J5_OIKDI|nr:Oidioi.mRNA.OKI2018_I69.PAR.g13192.t1.cds [Oikopleura dioica]
MLILSSLLLLGVYGKERLIKFAKNQLVVDNTASILIGGDFREHNPTSVQAKAGGKTFNCVIKESTDDSIKCSLALRKHIDEYRFTLFSRTDDGLTELVCDKPRNCLVSVDGAPTRTPNFEQGVKRFAPEAAPIITEVGPAEASYRGGTVFTIAGVNFGESLESFGEEGRSDNSDIHVFFANGLTYIPCPLITHWYNPGEIACQAEPFGREAQWATLVYLNGEKLIANCGDCIVQTRSPDSGNTVGFEVLHGNVAYPGPAPEWTEWTSVTGTVDGQELIFMDTFYAHNFGCRAPIAFQARHLDGTVLSEEDFEDFFEGSQASKIICPEDGCDGFEFRFLCDENSFFINLDGDRDNKDYSAFDVDERENHLMAIEIETDFPTPGIVASCGLGYTDSDELHHLYSVYAKDRWNGAATCRVDARAIGDFTISPIHLKAGRGVAEQDSLYMTEDGTTANFGLAPRIDSITPAEGSRFGGTFITITGRNLANNHQQTKIVLAGNVPCNIVSSSASEIICQVERQEIDTSGQTIFPGGLGAIDYFGDGTEKTQYELKSESGDMKGFFRVPVSGHYVLNNGLNYDLNQDGNYVSSGSSKVFLDADLQYGFEASQSKAYGYVFHGDGSEQTLDSLIPPYKTIQPTGHELETQLERQQVKVFSSSAEKTKHVILLETGSVSSSVEFRLRLRGGGSTRQTELLTFSDLASNGASLLNSWFADGFNAGADIDSVDVSASHGNARITVTFKGPGCENTLSAIEVVHANVVSESRQFTNAFGDSTTGFRSTINADGQTLVIDTWEHQMIIPGVSGSFQLHYKTWSSEVIDSETILEADLLTILNTAHLDLYTATIDHFERSCSNGFFFRVLFQKVGDFPEITATSNDMSPEASETSGTRHGGVVVAKMPGTALTKALDTPQVQLFVKNIAASCENCDFTFVTADTATSISTTSITLNGQSQSLTISGSGLDSTAIVMFGETSCTAETDFCTITSATSSSVTVSFTKLPWGTSPVYVVTDSGFADFTPGLEVTVSSSLGVSVSVGANGRNVNGGTLVTISGGGFGLAKRVINFGGIAAEEVDRTIDDVVVRSPEQPATRNGEVDITVDGDDGSLTTYVYDAAGDDIDMSVSSLSVTGDTVTITFTRTLADDTVTFYIETTPFHTAQVTGNTYELFIPAMEPGSYNFRALVGDFGFTNWYSIDTLLSVNTVVPAASSMAGGAVITINGDGFGTNQELTQVTIGGTNCDILTQTDKKITCLTHSQYKTHVATFVGTNWAPAHFVINQNDKIVWQWQLGTSINVNLESVPAGEFSYPAQSAAVGEVSRVFDEAPGFYTYTTGAIDNLGTSTPVGTIQIEAPVDNEQQVVVHVNGFVALKDQVRRWKKKKPSKNCAPIDADISSQIVENFVPANCTGCLKHTFSYSRTPIATGGSWFGSTVMVTASGLADNNACIDQYEMYAITKNNPEAKIPFTVTSVGTDGTIMGSLGETTDNWPVNEKVYVQVNQFGRGLTQIDETITGLQKTFQPTCSGIYPLEGSRHGGGILTISGENFAYDKYPTWKMAVNVCEEVISVSGTEIRCRLAPSQFVGLPLTIKVYYCETDFEEYDANAITLCANTGDEGFTMTFSGKRYTGVEPTNEMTNVVGPPEVQGAFTVDFDLPLVGEPSVVAGECRFWNASNPGEDWFDMDVTHSCDGSNCHFSMDLPSPTLDDYDVRLYLNNYGYIHVGQFFLGLEIKSFDNVIKKGSMGGGHVLEFTTNDNLGQIPTMTKVTFQFQGTNGWGDICGVIEDPDACKLVPVGSTKLQLITPDAWKWPNGLPGFTNKAYITFYNQLGQVDPRITCAPGVCDYEYDIMKTRIITDQTLSIHPLWNYRYIANEEVTFGIDMFHDNPPCDGITIAIGDRDCPITNCDPSALQLTCAVPGQATGEYNLYINFPGVGYAVHQEYWFEMGYWVDSVTPVAGSYGGGTSITITGSGFYDDDKIGTLCGEELINCQISADNTEAICQTPTIPDWKWENTTVCVFDFYHYDPPQRNDWVYTYENSTTAYINSIQPNKGGTLGGTKITIVGNKFIPGETTVTIDDVPCDIDFISVAVIVCETNAHEYSTAHLVKVTVPDGNAVFNHPDAAKFWYVDRWSSIFTWGCTELTNCTGKPVDGDIAVIPWNQTVLLDESTPLLKVLLIQGGTLVWDRTDGIKLRAEYVLITDGGHFEIGNEHDPFCGTPEEPISAEIEMYGHHRSIRLPIYGAKCFITREGTINMHGCPIDTTWTQLNMTAEAGDSSIYVRNPVTNPDSPMKSWKAGDKIVIATTGGRLSLAQSEERYIDSISEDGRTIFLTEPLTYRHIYHYSEWDGEILEVAAEVALLTRNIKFYGNVNDEWTKELPPCDEEYEPQEGAIQSCYQNKWGDEVGSDEFGAHFLMHNIEFGKIAHIEAFHVGQAFQFARYSFHFHRSGIQPNSYFRGNAVYNTFNRVLTTHGIHQALVEWNVGYNAMGHNFFIEDGCEEDNIIQYNLAIKTKPSNSLLNSDQKATAFWITNTFNTIQHNRAAGGVQMGYWVNPFERAFPHRGHQPHYQTTKCPVYRSVKKWYNNTAHDMGLYGFWVMTLQEGSSYRPSTVDCQSTWPPGEAIFERGIFWNCLRGAEFALVGDNIWMKGFIAANNILGGLSVKESSSGRYEGEYNQYGMGIRDSTVIGYIDKNVPELSLCTRFGIETPWKPAGHMSIEGIKFHNFDEGEGHNCVAIDACYSSYPFDCGRTSHFERVEYFNSPRKFAADWEHETVLVDRDGTLTGKGMAGWSVVPTSGLYPDSMCEPAPEFSVEFPCSFCQGVEFMRYGMNNIAPDSIIGFNMDVVNRYGSSVVPFRNKRSTHAVGWMGLLLAGETHDMSWQKHEHITNITYRGTVYDMGQHKHTTIRHPFYQEVDDAIVAGSKIRGYADSQGQSFNGQEVGALDTSMDPLTYHIDPQTSDFSIMFAKSDAINSYYDVNYNFEVFKCFWPDCTPPTTPPPTTPPTDLIECDWEDVACWEDGVVPISGSNVTIPVDKHVTLNTNLDVDILFLEGTLTISDAQDITINVRDILINTGAGGHEQLWTRSVYFQNGNLYAGTPDAPFNCDSTLSINFKGDRFQEEFGAPAGTVPIGAKTIGAMGGLSLVGCPQNTPYSFLQNSVSAGATSITLTDDVSADWKAGDKIVIAASSYDGRQYDELEVVAVSGNTVALNKALAFDHSGADAGETFKTEVVHLTRNIKLDGKTDSEDMFGGRIVVLSSDDGNSFRKGWAQLENIEMSHMGQFGHTRPDDLRTPVAFYHLGSQASADNPSYIKGCSMYNSYNGGIAIGLGVTNMQVTDNVMFNIVSDVIRVVGDYSIVTGNVIVMVVNRFLYQNWWLQQQLGNAEAEQMNLPAGINTIEVMTGTLMNNRVAGGDGPAYKGHAEECSLADLCTSNSWPMNIKNYAHSTLRGYSIIKKPSRACLRVEGFEFWRILDYGVYTQAGGSSVHVVGNKFIDTIIGVGHIMVGNGGPQGAHGNMKYSLDNNQFIGRSQHHTCADYNIRQQAAIVTSGLTGQNRAPLSEYNGHTGIMWPIFTENNVNLADCVDMTCDGMRKLLLKDMDGTLTGTGSETSIISQSEYQWRGVDGFFWSDNVDDSYGLGDYRVPESMLTNTDGTVISIDDYAPHKGLSRGDSCTWDANFLAYQCVGSSRAHLIFESLDMDQEERRVAPIGFRSSKGYIDLSNGPHDKSCCAGYSCSLRATLNHFVAECGETYDFHCTGTTPTEIQFAMYNVPSSCKIRIAMFTHRQNRQDVFLNGNNMIYSNQYDFATHNWKFPSPAFIPEVWHSSGSNYFDRADQILYFTLGGGDRLRVKIANTIILELDMVTELTIEEFYSSPDLPYLLAALLGLDPSQVKVVNVQRENWVRAQSTWSSDKTTVNKPHLKNAINVRVSIEFGKPLGTVFGRTIGTPDFSKIGSKLVQKQMDGDLENSIKSIATSQGNDLEVVATTLTSEPVQGKSSDWYEEGTLGEEITILNDLGITEDEALAADNVQQIVENKATATGQQDLIAETTIEKQAAKESIIASTTEAKVYDKIPTSMMIKQQPGEVVVNQRPKEGFQVVMLDENGEEMTDVGYTGDPFRVSIYETNGMFIDAPEVTFTPGSGIADFSGLRLPNTGSFQLTAFLTYSGTETNFTIPEVTSQQFEAIEAPPGSVRIEYINNGTVYAQEPFPEISVQIYDTNAEYMASCGPEGDECRVCVTTPTLEAGQLTGGLTALYLNGRAVFDNIKSTVDNSAVILTFSLCYNQGEDTVLVGKASTDPFVVRPNDDPQPPVLNRCVGNNTYDEDLVFNGNLGKGMVLFKVLLGRGSDSVPYFDASYGSEIYHKEGDKIRVACDSKGYVTGIKKLYSGFQCTCDGVNPCTFVQLNPDFVCVSTEDAMLPVWAGGVFNFVKKVYPSYVVLKASVKNLLKVGEWEFDHIDESKHPEWLDPNFWATADFTLFVWCPWNVTLGGPDGQSGAVTFPDFYEGEHSQDGTFGLFTVAKEHDFINPKTQPNRRISKGHQKNILAKYVEHFPIFEDGDFRRMVHYIRSAHKDLDNYEGYDVRK